MATASDQQLLYSLRSPTTPLTDKVAQAVAALSSSSSSTCQPSASLNQLIRDWALDVLLKSTRGAVTSESPLLSAELWSLLAQTTEATSTSSTSTPSLPIFVAFVAAYSSQPHRNASLLRSATAVWTRLASGAMRKATADAALDGYDKLVEASLRVSAEEQEAEERALWEELAVAWLKALRGVVMDAGKGGKKIPTHTLSLLPNLLPLLSRLSPCSPFRSTLLQTVQVALFNLDNLRRGLARESYTSASGSTSQPSASSATSTADSELLSALSSLPSSLLPSILAALPGFTQTYLSALSTHSATLFPLPAKASFPTPSAQKSALEVLGLGRRRDLAGRWVRGVVELVAWSKDQGESMQEDGSGLEGHEREKAAALAEVLAEVEKGDLYRSGQAGESWAGVLETIVRGAILRLQALPTSSESESVREALLDVLSAVERLDYEILDSELPKALEVLARTPASPSFSSTSTSTFLTLLITHHSRSLTLPTFLASLADALASAASLPIKTPNNLLTSHEFATKLGRAVSGMIGGASTGVRATWENLMAPITSGLQPAGPAAALALEDGAASPSPAKKRKLASSSSSSNAASALAAAARLRVLTLFVAHIPASSLSSLVGPFRSFNAEIVESELKDFLRAAVTPSSSSPAVAEDGEGTPSKKSKKSRRRSSVLPAAAAAAAGTGAGEADPAVVLGFELLEARYKALERMKAEGLLLETEEEGAGRWWELKKKRREGLREVVETGQGEAVVVAARTLLQHVELGAVAPEEVSSILSAILTRLGSSTGWSGFLRGMRDVEVPAALWEMVGRRWMGTIERFATDEQLKQLVGLLVSCLSADAESGAGITFNETTNRLLRRADLWELPRVQAQLRPALLALVTLPSLGSPSTVLSSLAASSASKSLTSLGSLTAATLLSTAHIFPRIAASVPLEYLGKGLRAQLAERALAMDLWISAEGRVEVEEQERERVQRELRAFVGFMGAAVEQAPQVLAQLVRRTLPGAKAATLELYRSLVQTSVATFKNTQSPTDLISFVSAFGEKPLSDLAKRAKKDGALAGGLTCEESAYVLLLETLAAGLGDVSSLPAPLLDTLRSSVKAASKPFGKALGAVTAVVPTSEVFEIGDILEACRAMWATRDWLGGKEAEEDAQVELFANFTQASLSAVLARLASSSSSPSALSTYLSLLELLSYRTKRLRSLSSESKVATEPFETLIACHLLFRRSFGPSASAALDSNLVRASSTSSLREYTVALEGVSSAVAAAVGTSLTSLDKTLGELQASLSVALALLRDGPDGSSRISSASLSELLRHLSLMVERVAAKEEQDEAAAKAYLLAATFIEGVCGDRPMLLSRLNVSTVLSLVSRILQPSPVTAPTASPATPSTASLLFRTLASTVGHVVRHRKDHIVPLFPQLVSTLSAFLSILRRAGFGSTGSAASIEEADTGIALGQRAEREARATFPAWAWQGGAAAVGKPEAAAVGRLLGSLTAKTTTTLNKRKHGSRTTTTAHDDGPSTTTSLAAPLSKHAPFLLLSYLRACVHPTCPVPSSLRAELQGGWFEVMDAMGKWEREALMKGFLGEDEESERGILRALWKSWEKERYRG
ncbi:hypothetical protein JCM1840_006498 [Sporobolomyces johnsonii]